jgi:hypothetical protein
MEKKLNKKDGTATIVKELKILGAIANTANTMSKDIRYSLFGGAAFANN